jgi:hypothetical protein
LQKEEKMSIRRIIDLAIEDTRTTLYGTVASEFYAYYDSNGNWCWACDVDIGEDEPLTCVPVASNNREIIFAQEGKGVNLTKTSSGKYQITGLSKTVNSTKHYIYLSASDDIFRIVRTEMVRFTVRKLTYGELGTLVPPYGYGVLPYGARGRFDYEGNFLGIVE